MGLLCDCLKNIYILNIDKSLFLSLQFLTALLPACTFLFACFIFVFLPVKERARKKVREVPLIQTLLAELLCKLQ